jgi:hypothetical protein
VVAKIEPDVDISIEEREAWRRDVEATKVVEGIKVRSGRDAIVMSWWERPSTPLLAEKIQLSFMITSRKMDSDSRIIYLEKTHY